ncbi:hypothetical protein ACFLYO_09465 [Chloroflexota bacterium]
MKFNLKALIVSVLAVAVVYAAINSILPRSYSGSDLTFEVSSGTVTITNPSAESIPAQLVSTSGSFRVSSAIEDLSGSSTRQGTGSSATYLMEFELPPSVSEIAITRGRKINFVADTATKLEATVQPVSSGTARTTIIVAVVVVLAALFYISHTTNHRWILILRRQETLVLPLKPAAETITGGQGRAFRSYGDNVGKKDD